MQLFMKPTMTKSVILFVVLLIFEGSHQTTLESSRLNELEEVIEEFAAAIKDVNNIIEFVSGHLSSIARDYEHKIDDTLDNENIAAIVQNLQNAIHKIESDIDENSKSCIDLAFRQAFVATDELKRSIDSCIANARDVATDILSHLEAIDGKVLKIQEDITTGFHSCMGQEISEETVQCLKDVIEPAKDTLKVLDQQVVDTNELVQQKVSDGIRNFNICLQKQEQDFGLKKDTILKNLDTCAQRSYHTSLRSSLSDEISEFSNQIATATVDMEVSMDLVESEHFKSIASEYEYKVGNSTDKEEIATNIKNLQDAIRKVESTTGENSKSCVDSAFRESYIATGELLRGTDSCVAKAQAIVPEIKSHRAAINNQLGELFSDTLDGWRNCSRLSDVLKVTCLRVLFEPLKEKLKVLNYKVVDVHELLHNMAEGGIRNINTCLRKEEVDFEEKSKTILKDLDKCVQSTSRFSRQYTSKGIMDVIREIKEKIANILHIISHLPTSIDEIQDKISEIVSHINISSLISQLKNEVNEIINDGGSNAEKCRPIANERMDSLVETSETAANKCMQDAENKVEEIKASISALGDEAQEILGEIKNQSYQCFIENKLNPAEFYKCLERHVDEYQQRAADLQKKVGDVYEEAKDKADEILQSLAQCMNTVQMDTVKEGQVIIKDVESCVLHSSDTYYM